MTIAENPPNSESAGSKSLASPKRRRFALRSLALSENFLEAATQRIDDDLSMDLYGQHLANGVDFRGSVDLRLAKAVLEGLIDPATQRGQKGTWLLFPFHESLLWYDARRTQGRPWGVRKVYMRGSGITLARLLLQPPGEEELQKLGEVAVSLILAALHQVSPLSTIAATLEQAFLREERPLVEDDEREAWQKGENLELRPLAASLCRHVHDIMAQHSPSGPARLWQLRTLLALDFALHTLQRAWQATNAPESERYLLLSFGEIPRSENPIRHRSEDSYQRARMRIREATVTRLAERMCAISKTAGSDADWGDELENRRGRLEQIARDLKSASTPDDFHRLARTAAEDSNYDRTGEGFRVLLESVGMLAGTRYRYLTATPDLLAAMVGSLSSKMPMSSTDFFIEAYRNWRIVISPEAAMGMDAYSQLDGAELARNAQRAEQLLIDAGLAVSLSDQTTFVGDRVGANK